MRLLFFDSSALVKRYLTETGSTWVTNLTDSASGNTSIIAEITRVEVAAALAARHRASAGITLAERDQLVTLLLNHCDAEYLLIPLSNQVCDYAVALTQRYRLRGYDAVQLATALDTRTTMLAAGLPDLTFITSDDDLLAAAHAEGLAGDNPNQHL